MQKSGTIKDVRASQRVGYQSQNGYIYTFDISIDCPDGVIVGEIGSKSQFYPKNPGNPITVEVTETQHGTKFKNVNPQYTQPNTGQPTGGGAPQQGQPNWDEIARGKVRCNLVCAAIQGGQLKATCPSECEAYMDYIFTGRTGGGPNPSWVGENPPPTGPGDDVPF